MLTNKNGKFFLFGIFSIIFAFNFPMTERFETIKIALFTLFTVLCIWKIDFEFSKKIMRMFLLSVLHLNFWIFFSPQSILPTVNSPFSFWVLLPVFFVFTEIFRSHSLKLSFNLDKFLDFIFYGLVIIYFLQKLGLMSTNFGQQIILDPVSTIGNPTWLGTILATIFIYNSLEKINFFQLILLLIMLFFTNSFIPTLALILFIIVKFIQSAQLKLIIILLVCILGVNFADISFVRTTILTNALEKLQELPLRQKVLGNGVNSIGQDIDLNSENLNIFDIRTTDSFLLDMIFDYGFVGGLLTLAAFYFLIKSTDKRKQFALLTLTLGIFTQPPNFILIFFFVLFSSYGKYEKSNLLFSKSQLILLITPSIIIILLNSFASIYHNDATYYRRIGDVEFARLKYKSALFLNPLDSEIWLDMSEISENGNNKLRSLKIFENFGVNAMNRFREIEFNKKQN